MAHLETDVRALGAGGPRVTSLGLGTMTFGAESDEEASFQMLDLYRESGGTYLDTADVYAAGESERIVGRWLASRKVGDEILVATKGRFGPPPGSTGASYRGIVKAIDASLERLGLDVVDVYFVHGWDPAVPVEDTLAALTNAVGAGKILTVGWSNTTAWQFQRILDTARTDGYVVPKVFQPQYNLLDRTIELDVLPLLLDEGIATTPWSPLGGGWLTGKYRRDQRPTGATRLGENPARGVEAYDKRNTDRTWDILEVAQEIAEAHETSMAAVSLAWLLTRPSVVSVLLGARTADQLRDTLVAVDVALEDSEIDRLTAVSAPGIPDYPYGFLRDLCQVTVWDELGTVAGE